MVGRFVSLFVGGRFFSAFGKIVLFLNQVAAAADQTFQTGRFCARTLPEAERLAYAALISQDREPLVQESKKNLCLWNHSAGNIRVAFPAFAK